MLRPTFVPPQAAQYRALGGPWDVPTLDALLHSAPLRDDLVVAAGQVWSTALVEHSVARLAGALRAAGVSRGDVVAWQLPNGIAPLLLFRSCWRLGAIGAPLHPRAGRAEVDAMVSVLAPAFVATSSDDVLSLVRQTGPAAPGIDLEDSVARSEDIAVVLFTAGSTGAPKGVLHTHRSLAYKTLTMIDSHGLTSSDVVLMPAPLAHVSGLLNGVLVPGCAGMSSVLMSRWSPARALELIERHQVSFMVGPPTFFVALTDDPGFTGERVRSLRLISCGGAGVTDSFVRTASSALGATVKRSYGSTEAPTVATATAGDPPERMAGYDGRAVGLAELRVVEPPSPGEPLVPLRPGTEGELLVRGPEVCAGYLSDRDNVGVFIEDGWFRTGDLASIDVDGWLRITGRLNDVIIRGGENIAIAEVEALLEAHPAVRRAAVVGRTDDRVGERVVAIVVTSSGFDLEACRAWFDHRGTARFKAPEEIIVVDEIPLLPTGKVDRAALRGLLRSGD